ncbi:MAG: hypothetical protein ISS31_06385 [Kiritimatiellae bacterium]|nr:hypothetical protein [Kiritimatiellia bacterium]
MLLPDATRRGEIKFVVARSLPYNARMLIVMGLLFMGFGIQIYGYLFLGAAFLLAATVLSIVRGYSNVPGQLKGKREWRVGNHDQLRTIVKIAEQSKRWDQSLLDITCLRGFLVLAAAVIGITVACIGLFILSQDDLMHALVLDTAVLLLPHWLTGVRRILTNAPLTTKVEQLLSIVSYWEAHPEPGETLTPQIEFRTDGAGEVPTDAKLIMGLPELGDTFPGLQVQVVLNNVQGSDFPYVYCVLVAKPKLNMLKKIKLDAAQGTVLEPKHQGDVDIIVVRQQTTKTSGYHTKPAKVLAIFHLARAMARQLLD